VKGGRKERGKGWGGGYMEKKRDRGRDALVQTLATHSIHSCFLKGPDLALLLLLLLLLLPHSFLVLVLQLVPALSFVSSL